MERVRTPWQGTWNIVRFNWHFYALAAGAGVALVLLAGGLAGWPGRLALGAAGLLGATTVVSLLVSAYVYDGSGLYRLDWLRPLLPAAPAAVVNIHAGLDETSARLRQVLRPASLTVLDFYDSARHTERAIRRARRAYPAYPGTLAVRPDQLPLPAAHADLVLLMLAAHEIRTAAERAAFLREAGRVLRPGGRIVVVEHLRDARNLLAYSIGAFHFYSRGSWRRVFGAAGLRLRREVRLTPFLMVFVLTADDTAA